MASKIQYVHNWWRSFNCSVADPDPHVFGPSGSGSDPDPLVRGMDLDPFNIKQKK